MYLVLYLEWNDNSLYDANPDPKKAKGTDGTAALSFKSAVSCTAMLLLSGSMQLIGPAIGRVIVTELNHVRERKFHQRALWKEVAITTAALGMCIAATATAGTCVLFTQVLLLVLVWCTTHDQTIFLGPEGNSLHI